MSGLVVVEASRYVAGVVAGVVLVAAALVVTAWVTRDDRATVIADAVAEVDADRATRGNLLWRTRVLHPELGLGTIALDPPLPGGIFPVVFDLDHPKRVRWEPAILLSPVGPADERNLETLRRRGVELFPLPPTLRVDVPAPRAASGPSPCAPGRPCPWHNPDDCWAVAPCCEACPTTPSV